MIRVAPIVPDERDTPGRTQAGEPWVRWMKIGSNAGWYARGTRETKFREPTFWETVFLLCAEDGARMDTAHSVGPAMLAIGPLGLTVMSGWAQALLKAAFIAHPERYMRVMRQTVHITGAHVFSSERAASGASFGYGDEEILAEPELRDLLTLGSGPETTWKSHGKERSHLWVESCSRLLRDARFDRVQVAMLADMLPRLLSERAKELLCWPGAGVTSGWGWSVEQRMLWSITLALALYDDDQTNALVAAIVQEAPVDADASLRQIMAIASQFEDTFAQKVVATVKRAGELFKVSYG